MSIIYILLYVASIVGANVLTAGTHPLVIDSLIIPWGTFLIGMTFILRDYVQSFMGRIRTYLVVIAALIISAISSLTLGDMLWIVAASAVTFAVSETMATEVYARMSDNFAKRVLFSGLIGGTIDSALFVVIGLSPLGAGFIPWQAVPIAIVSQVIVKLPMQAIAAYLIKRRRDAA